MESQAFQGMLANNPQTVPRQQHKSNKRSLRPPKMGEQQGKQLADKQIPRTPVKTEAPQGMQRHTNAKNRTAHGADGGKKCKPEMFARQTE